MALFNKIVSFEWAGSPESVDINLYSGDTYRLQLVTTKSTGAAITATDFPDSVAEAVTVSDSNGTITFASAPTATFSSGSVTVVFPAASTSHLEGRSGLRYDVSASGWTLAQGTITLNQDA